MTEKSLIDIPLAVSILVSEKLDELYHNGNEVYDFSGKTSIYTEDGLKKYRYWEQHYTTLLTSCNNGTTQN